MQVTDTALQSAPAFTDRHGAVHELVCGHRDKIKPGWRRMLDSHKSDADRTDHAVEFRGLSDRLKLAESVLAAFGGTIKGREVLTVGCGDWTEPRFLSAWGASRVVGIDRKLSGDALDDERLTKLAGEYLRSAGQPAAADGTIALKTDNIASSALPDASFDLVCSWRTLEHIIEPAEAFTEMFRLLRPGGLAYHEYNPFFAIDGGHSLVTLDILWGHVRFDRDDIARYMKQHRPNEVEPSLKYLDNCLNSMTMCDLKRYAKEAGFELLALVPRTRTEDLMRVDAQLLNAAKRNHPTATLDDLISRIVRVVLRRP